MNARRTDFTPPRLAEHRRRQNAGQNTRGVFASAIAIAAVVAVGLIMLALAGAIARSLTSDGSSVVPGLNFDNVVNGTVDSMIGLLPSAFSSNEETSAAQTPAETATPAPTPEPTPTPVPTIDPATVKGDPLSLSALISGWQGRALTAQTLAADATAYSGFTLTPAIVQLTSGSKTIELAAFVYPTRDAVREDWNQSGNGRPSPKPDRDLPDNRSTWWNRNTVVVVLQDPGGLSGAALDGYLDAR